MPAKSKRVSKDEPRRIPIAKLVSFSLIASVLCFGADALFALIILKSGIGDTYYSAFGFSAAIISAIAGGWLSAGAVGHSGFLYGALSGTVQGFVCAAVHYAVNKPDFGVGTVFIFFIIVLSSSMGGICRVNMKKRMKY